MTPIRITSEGSGIGVSGELDAQSAPTLEAAAAKLSGSVDLDLSECSFIDSAGLTSLLLIRDRIIDRGGSMTIVGLSDSARRLIEICGLSETFGVHHDALD
ncbi:MAG: STAS domain-containing protein [Ilumatobacter sp.]|uniref:STAS domain-containing protein n=1 Tax=Ilumatobacter sp. TaxID=1967498 RepID=UPI00329816E7